MPALGKQRHFEILRQVLAMVDERRLVPLDEAADAVGVTATQLKELLDPVLFLAFRTQTDRKELIDESRAFLFTEDGELELTDRHWLRDLAAEPPSPEVALRLLVAGLMMQSIATRPTPDLDRAVDKLSEVVGARLEVTIPAPAALAAARESWATGRSLRFRYVRDTDDAASDREAVPYRVYCKWGHWYFQGRELDTDPGGEPKVFRIDRMHDASVGDVAFDPPPDTEIPDWFDLTEHEQSVTLVLTEQQINALPRATRVTSQSKRSDGRIEAIVVVSGERRLDHLLVSLDPDVEVVAPEDARARQRQHATELLTVYT